MSAESAKAALEGDKEEMAIDALEQEPVKHSIKPVATSTEEVDLISRVDAMGAVQDHFNADGFKGYYDGQKMMDRITALPSADMRGDTE